jgi:hypothetical protein
MNRMTKFLAVAVVLAVMALGPTMSMAAPANGGSVALGHASSFSSILELFAKLLGLQPAASTAPTTVSPSGGPNVSTESAIWGFCRGVNC